MFVSLSSTHKSQHISDLWGFVEWSQVMGPITRAAHVFMKSNKTEFVLFVSAQGSNYREVGLQLTCSLILLSFHTNTRTRPTSIEDRSRSSVSCTYTTICAPVIIISSLLTTILVCQNKKTI